MVIVPSREGRTGGRTAAPTHTLSNKRNAEGGVPYRTGGIYAAPTYYLLIICPSNSLS